MAFIDKVTVGGTTYDLQDSALKSALNGLDATVNGVTTKNYTEGKNFSANSQSHSIIDDNNSCISDYIPATWGASDKIGFVYTDDATDSTTYQLWYFDSNKDFLGYVGRNPTGTNKRSNLTPITNTAYIRISFKKGFAAYAHKNGDESTKYYTAASTVTTAGHEQKIGNLDNLSTTEKTNLVGAVNEVSEHFPITPKDTSFFYIGKNMFDPSTWIDGEYVNQTNGSFQDNSAHHRTDYIPVESGEKYFVLYNSDVNVGTRYAFYNSNKGYVSGAQETFGSSGLLLTVPSTAKYIAISNSSKSLHLMITKSDSATTFEEYSQYILPKYIREDLTDLILNIPSKIYALVGYELNIYFENITEDWAKYKWDVTCSKGMQLERGYRITPAAGDDGEYTLTIKASLSETVYKEVSTTLVVSAALAGDGDSTSVIILGDSTTYNSIAVTKLAGNFSDDVMSLSTLGTMGTSPLNHEGRSGWKLSDYFTKAQIVYPSPDPRGTINNPFYNPTTETFDADYYFDNSGVSVPEWFIINMGINDMFGYNTDDDLSQHITEGIEYIDAMIESLHSVSESMKVCVCCTIPPNHSQDAFGKAYACGQTRDRYKRNNTLWVKRLIEEYDNRTDEGIYMIPIHTNLDTVNNMGLEDLPVNARNTSITYKSPISNGGVHPVESGYWQIADVYTAFLKGNVS